MGPQGLLEFYTGSGNLAERSAPRIRASLEALGSTRRQLPAQRAQSPIECVTCEVSPDLVPRGQEDSAALSRMLCGSQALPRSCQSAEPSMPETLTLTRPDDWHLHLRDGPALATSVRATAEVFGRAIVMPNLGPPVTTVEQALAYRGRILEALPDGSDFEPLMTLYLTDRTSREEVQRAAACEHVLAFKYYPAGATTNSESGVTGLENVYSVLEVMEEKGLPLLVHGEVTDPAVDVFDREKAFIDRVLSGLVERFSSLRLVFEHITTADAVQFVMGAREGVAATLTPQHLLMNRNDLFVGGLQPHNYCLPVLKRGAHQEALRRAATGGNPRFFLGTDSAPHARGAKESACGCAGCFSSPAALPLYAQCFEELQALDRLEAFASHFGPDFYGIDRNTSTLTLRRETWMVSDELEFHSGEKIVPYWAGRQLSWQVA